MTVNAANWTTRGLIRRRNIGAHIVLETCVGDADVVWTATLCGADATGLGARQRIEPTQAAAEAAAEAAIVAVIARLSADVADLV